MPEGPSGPAASVAASPPRGTRWRRRWRSTKLVVRDHSMEPGLRPGDRLLLDPLAYRDRAPERGDVVVIADPTAPERLLLKRVVGTPGDFVRITRDGAHRLETPSRPGAAPPDGALEELEVPPGHLFVLSDRPTRTRDSRQFGPVPIASVAGRVWYRYGPRARRGELGAAALSEP